MVDGLDDKEIDLEGVTTHDDCVVAIGSLSRKRARIKPSHDLGKALERLGKVTTASGGKRTHSDHAYRLRPRLVDGRLVVDLVDRIEVRSRLAKLDLLAPFADLPSKDNGLDAEGLALHDGHFYLGLRGPVLRGYALLVRLSRQLDQPRLLPVDLGGWGVRAVTSAGARGLWVVSGPTMVHPGPFTLWRVEPAGRALPTVERIGDIAVEGAGNVETVFGWQGQLRVLLDGPPGGDPRTVCIVEP